MAAYYAALAAMPDKPSEIGASRTSPGTINALVVAYYKSAAWNNLAPDTRKSRRRFIERFRIQHGDKRVALLRRDHIENMLAAIEKPNAKRGWLKAFVRCCNRLCRACERMTRPPALPGSNCPKARGITLGPTTRSNGTARIGRSARNSGLSWNLR
jgi:hypothetical protein